MEHDNGAVLDPRQPHEPLAPQSERAAGGMTAPSFERWHLDLAPLTERSTDSTEWADALVLVERGSVDVVCADGAHRRFGAGCLVAFGWLPITSLRNPTTQVTRLLAVRRRVPAHPEGGLPSDRS